MLKNQNKSKKINNNFSAKKIISNILEKNNEYWDKERKRRALSLFYAVAERVPAYKDFLKNNKISPNEIKTFKDLESVPPINKDNYLRKYSLEKLSWDGSLNGFNNESLVFTSTSGSTGEPFYFSRDSSIDKQAAIIHELYFRNSHLSYDAPTLVVVCFGMGVWIGGVITYQAFEITGKGDYPISIITPGINKEEIFKILKKLAPHFKQVILAGYPPFLKDIVDEAPEQDVDLKKLKVRLLFAAEAFTETFRNYVSKKAKVHNPLTDTMNIYGTADIGAIAFETPLSILIRRIAMKNPKLFKSLFSIMHKTPTLSQYISSFISFQSPNNEILVTGNSSIPLIRYSIGDHGGTFSFNQVKDIFIGNGIDLEKEARRAGIKDYMYQLPFVYVYERIDMSTTLYGLQIYPETVKEVLLETPFNKFLTGKLTLVSKFDTHHNQYLEINLELKKNGEVSNVLKTQLLNEIIKNLRLKNSEYRELSDFLGKRASPKLVFWPREYPLYFKPGVKQKWVDK